MIKLFGQNNRSKHGIEWRETRQSHRFFTIDLYLKPCAVKDCVHRFI